MTEEFTDAEIIKALEVHGNEKFDNCEGCPYLDGDSCEGFPKYSKPYRDVLDLINRQKAQITNLLEERETLLKECKKCGRKHGRKVSKLQREIERLKNQIKVGDKIYEDTCKKSQGEIDCWRRTCKQAKSEAYREFAERLKATKFTHKNLGELVYVEDIDNTLDELTGGANNE